MAKRIAVLVRERQEEALRVSLGLTLAGCVVEVFVLDGPLAPTPTALGHLEGLREAGVPVAADRPGATLPHAGLAEIARRILACDHVVAY